MQERSQGGRLGAVLAVLGGLVIVIGSVLSWAKASVTGFSTTAKGINGWEGKATIFGGVILLIGGLSALAAPGARARLRASAIVGGGIAAGVGIYTALTATDQVIDDAASEIGKQLGIPFEQARAAMQEAMDQGAFKISLEIGLYLVIAGGLVGIAVGLLTRVRRASSSPLATPSGAGLTGWTTPAPPASPQRVSPPVSVPGEPFPDVWAPPAPPPPTGREPVVDEGPAGSKE
jgi:hypothetical protein